MNALKSWAIDTGIRAVKTGAQTAVALLGANSAGLTSVNWVQVLDISALAVVVSILHNVSGMKTDWYYEGGKPTPVETPDQGPVI